jgi:hypothetical protein
MGTNLQFTNILLELLTKCGVIFFRHVIAIIHFNKNLSREKRTKDGIEQYNVIYPKFMNGEAVVRKVSVKQNFGKLYITIWCQCAFPTPLHSLNPTTIIEQGD